MADKKNTTPASCFWFDDTLPEIIDKFKKLLVPHGLNVETSGDDDECMSVKVAPLVASKVPNYESLREAATKRIKYGAELSHKLGGVLVHLEDVRIDPHELLTLLRELDRLRALSPWDRAAPWQSVSQNEETKPK